MTTTTQSQTNQKPRRGRRYPQLRIKICSLAEEAKIIRRNEREWSGHLHERFELHHHRVEVVRPHARAAQLAYGLLRGRQYAQIENIETRRTLPDWREVKRNVARFGNMKEADANALVDEWGPDKDKGRGVLPSSSPDFATTGSTSTKPKNSTQALRSMFRTLWARQ